LRQRVRLGYGQDVLDSSDDSPVHSADTEPAGDRLELLHALTAAAPGWALLKGADAALSGTGDIDALAPQESWPVVAAAFTAWAEGTGRGPVVACEHVPGSLVLAAVEPGSPPTLVQLDLLAWRRRRGIELLDAERLGPDAELDGRGFRRLRTGAEGVARLLLDEFGPWGTARHEDGSRELAELVQVDPAGATRTAARLGPEVERAVGEVAEGRWPRGPLLRLELRGFRRALARPRATLGRRRAARSARSCPLLQALRNERTIEGDVQQWLAAVARSHTRVRL
jgi:hypothetical protein